MSAECRSGRGGGLQTRSYPVRVRIGAPGLFHVPEWRNEYALVLETSSFGSESASLSSGTKTFCERCAGVLLGEQAVSKAAAQSSNHCPGAKIDESRRFTMANKTLFQTIFGGLIPATDTVNSEKAPAYALS